MSDGNGLYTSASESVEGKKYPTPEEVFTPTSPPTEKENVYVRRELIEKKLAKNLKTKTPIVYGDYGVGKTSLCLKVVNERYGDSPLIRVTDTTDKSISDVFRSAFEEINFTVESYEDNLSGVVSESRSTAGFGLSLKVVSGKGENAEGKSTTRTGSVRRELLVKEPTDEKALTVFSEAKIVFLIDELHYANEDFKKQLARCIKSISDLKFQYPKFIFSGTANDSSSLADVNPGVDRLLQEVRVPPFDEAESKELLNAGFAKLGLEVELGVVEKIAEVTAGAPSLVQSIGLELADLTLEGAGRRVEPSQLPEALDEVIHSGANERMSERYNKAINHVGQRKYRTHILHAMAASTETFVTSDWISDFVSESLETNVPTTTLSGPLRELKQEEFGAILSDVVTASGKTVKNQTRFTQPQMKSFIRFLTKANAVS